MLKKFSRSNAVLWLLGAVLLAFHLAWAYRWAHTEARPPSWDPAVHLGAAADYKDALHQGRWFDLLKTRPAPGHAPYPPLYHYFLTAVLDSQRPHAAAVWVNLIFFSVLAGASAWVALQIGSVAAAAATLVVLALSPVLIDLFREPFPDLPMAAWTALVYAFALRSKFFEDRRFSLAAGAAAALALASKWSAPVYLLPAIIPAFHDARRRKNLAWAFAPLLICAPWYLINAVEVIPRVIVSANLGAGEGDPDLWTKANWLYYARFLGLCFSVPAGLAFLAGAAWSLRGKKRDLGRIVVASWLALSYLAFSFVSNKNDRYILPAAAALPALGFSALPAPLLGAAAAWAVWHSRNTVPADASTWHLPEILDELAARRRASGLTSLCVLVNHSRMSATTLSWLIRHRGIDGLYAGCQQSEIPEWSDLVLLKTGDPGAYLADGTYAILSQAASGKGLFHAVFREVRRWPLPDGSEAVLYQQRSDAPWIASPLRREAMRIRSAKLEGVTLTPLAAGQYRVEIAKLTLDKLPAPIEGLRLKLSGARLAEHAGKVYVLGLDAVELEAAGALWAPLSEALARRSGLKIGVSSADDALRVEAKLGPLALHLDLLPLIEESQIQIRLRRGRLAGLPLPRLSFTRSLDAAPPYRPYDLRMAPLSLGSAGPRIGPPLP